MTHIKYLGALLIGFIMVLCVSCAKEKEGPVSGKQQTIKVELQAPDTTWGIEIQNVYQVNNELWVISALKQLPGEVLGAMVITPVFDQVVVPVSSETVKYFILGKTWNWENAEPYTFIQSVEEIKDDLKDAKTIEFTRS
ncbi:MAG: hypothetical protein HY559_02575 [Gammaproteobacteria bacterium]|nr:hypothetical protein [Gammaproteobacteria bacterium]